MVHSLLYTLQAAEDIKLTSSFILRKSTAQSKIAQSTISTALTARRSQILKARLIITYIANHRERLFHLGVRWTCNYVISVYHVTWKMAQKMNFNIVKKIHKLTFSTLLMMIDNPPQKKTKNKNMKINEQ